MVFSDIERGYLAGFIDGEGCIGLGCRNNPAKCRPYRWVIFGHIDNTNREAIYYIYNLIQKLGKAGYVQELKGIKRPKYRITVCSGLLKPLLLEIKEYLIVKRRQAELVLEAIPILASNRGNGWRIEHDKRLREIYLEIRNLNQGAKLKSGNHFKIFVEPTMSEKTVNKFLKGK